MNLARAKVVTMIPTTNLQGTRRFYEDQLGFVPSAESPQSVEYKTGDGQFNLYVSGSAGTAQHTLVGWLVEDVDAAVDALSANGVVFERYDMPGLKTNDKGVAVIMEAGKEERAAWFKDPEGNILSIWQVPK